MVGDSKKENCCLKLECFLKQYDFTCKFILLSKKFENYGMAYINIFF
jgi:hypothetical protein